LLNSSSLVLSFICFSSPIESWSLGAPISPFPQVLAVGETVEEVTDSGLFARAPTLTVQLLADGSMLQVYPNAVRHVRAGGRSAEWKPPGKKLIEKASANARQVKDG
jgi:hypothetical protein